ncbi:MAG: hypothetical protein EU548_09225 [Promethearchaeota archaeon]|nr:MAG: hypothetical protein EU548_09225 [Candidatus Lokiarchaeota archaeon]
MKKIHKNIIFSIAIFEFLFSIALPITIVNLLILFNRYMFVSADSITRSIDILVLPVIIGLILGILLANLSIKRKSKSLGRFIQISAIFGLAFSPLFLPFLLQYLSYKFDFLPATGYRKASIADPPTITNFRIIDSILSGQFNIAIDYLYHLILPWIVMTCAITALITLISRSYQLNKSENRSIVPISLYFGIIFGVISGFSLLVESIFYFNGAFQGIIRIMNFYGKNSAFPIIFPLCFTILSIVTNMGFILFGYIKNRKANISRMKNSDIFQSTENETTLENSGYKKEISDNNNAQPTINLNELKKYFLKKLRSPFTLFGLLIIIFAIFISIFPMIFTPYSKEEYFLGIVFNPPSASHPLGTTDFGRDILALIIYGTSDSLLFAFFTVLIALSGGLILGIPMSLINKDFNLSSEILMIFMYIFPMIIILILFEVNFIIFGILMIPLFTQIIAHTNFNILNIVKKVIIYLPLIFGFIILLYNTLGFLGFLRDPNAIVFGNIISIGVGRIVDAPWATFYPCLALFILVMGFFLVYGGLQKVYN